MARGSSSASAACPISPPPKAPIAHMTAAACGVPRCRSIGNTTCVQPCNPSSPTLSDITPNNVEHAASNSSASSIPERSSRAGANARRSEAIPPSHTAQRQPGTAEAASCRRWVIFSERLALRRLLIRESSHPIKPLMARTAQIPDGLDLHRKPAARRAASGHGSSNCSLEPCPVRFRWDPAVVASSFQPVGDGIGGCVSGTVGDCGVQIQGDGGAGVAEHVGHDLDWDTGVQGLGGGTMSEIVRGP